MNKKAIQLSINFIVMLILAIAVFSIGLTFIGKFFGFADKEKLRWNDMVEKEIENALDDGSRVSVPRNRRTVPNGEFATFGIGVLNAIQGTGKDFNIKISYKDCTANSCGTPDNWLTAMDDPTGPIEIGPINIKNNEKKKLLLGIEPTGAEKGTYIFDVLVCVNEPSLAGNADCGALDPSTPNAYAAIQKIWVEVP